MSVTNWFRGLRFRLSVLVFLPAVMMTAVAYLGFQSINLLSGELDVATRVNLPLEAYSSDMSEAVQGVTRTLWAAYAAGRDEQMRKYYKDKAGHFIVQFEESQKKYEELPRSDQEKAIFQSIPSNWKIMRESMSKILAKLEVNTDAADAEIHDMMFQDLKPIVAPIEKSFDEVSQHRIEMGKQEAIQASKDAETSRNILLTISGCTVLGLIVFGFFLSSRLSSQLSQITARISSSGERVATASEQLSAAGQTLSAGASEAASSLEQTVSSLEELSSMVKQNADNAKEAGALSLSAKSSAEEGEREIRDLIAAMTDIAQSSKKIEEIINVIDDIAFQTNLLALNAAVEAARAGEQGKGFAVVADAVRNLAQRSASAAKDITALIKDSVNKVDRGSVIADKSGTVLKNIVMSVKKVTDLNSEISVASQEQANGISQISQAMNQLDQATQSNAASAEEAASSSEEMSVEAESLKTEVGTLLTIVEGNSKAAVENREMTQTVNSRQASRAVQRRAPQSSRGAHNLQVVKAGQRSEAAKAIPFQDEEPAAKISDASGF